MKNRKNFFAAICSVRYVCLALVLSSAAMLMLRVTGIARIPIAVVFAPLWVPVATTVISMSVMVVIAALDGRKPRYITKDIEDGH